MKMDMLKRKGNEMWKQLTTFEPGVTIWVHTDHIDTIQRVDPTQLKSDLIINPNIDKDPVTVVTTKYHNKAVVKETPEEILQTN